MRFRIGSQLFAAFAVLVLLLSSAIAGALYALHTIGTAQASVRAAVALRAEAADVVLQRVLTRFAIRNLVLTDMRVQATAEAQATDMLNRDITFLAAHDGGDHVLARDVLRLQQLATAINERNAFQVQAIERFPTAALAAFRGKSTAGLSHAVVRSLADNAVDIPKEASVATDVVDLTARRVRNAQAQFNAVYHLGLLGGIAAIVCAVSLSIGIAFLFGRRMTRRLAVVRDAIERIASTDIDALRGAFRALAAGDLRVRLALRPPPLTARGADEITELTRCYNDLGNGFSELAQDLSHMATQLRGVVSGVVASSGEFAGASAEVGVASTQALIAVQEISRAIVGVADAARNQAVSSREVSVASEEISRASAQIAIGARDQATSLQQAATAVSELDEQVNALTDLAQLMAETARTATSDATTGADAVQVTDGAIKQLRQQFTVAEQAMHTLEKRSTAVGEIVSTIEDIADQTNLLALNAAIEAARAGEHGRGFAVVADEIRKLAERSAGSTREIATILASISEETGRVGTSMRSSYEALQEGMSRAQDATHALGKVAASITRTKESAEELAARTERMNESSRKMSANVASVSSVVDENAAAVAQMRATTEHVAASILPVAAAAEEQSAAAEQVSSSASELAAQIEAMQTTAAGVRTGSSSLKDIVAFFRVDDEDDVPRLRQHSPARALSSGTAG